MRIIWYQSNMHSLHSWQIENVLSHTFADSIFTYVTMLFVSLLLLYDCHIFGFGTAGETKQVVKGYYIFHSVLTFYSLTKKCISLK